MIALVTAGAFLFVKIKKTAQAAAEKTLKSHKFKKIKKICTILLQNHDKKVII